MDDPLTTVVAVLRPALLNRDSFLNSFFSCAAAQTEQERPLFEPDLGSFRTNFAVGSYFKRSRYMFSVLALWAWNELARKDSSIEEQLKNNQTSKKEDGSE